MDLQVFIRESITQIVNGLVEADSAIKSSDAAVNPRNVVVNKAGDGPYGSFMHDRARDAYRPVDCIEFDVAVTVTHSKETKGGLGLHVGAIGVGTSGRSEAESGSESRIRFRVPVMMPISKNA